MTNLKNLLLIFTFLFSSFLWAKSPGEIFESHFRVEREKKEVVSIHSRIMPQNIRIQTYLKFIKDQLQNEQRLMKSKKDYYAQAENNLVELYGSYNEDVRITLDGLRELEKTDFDYVFSNPNFQKVMKKFEFKLKDFWESLNPTTLAKLDNPAFFRNKQIAGVVLKTGLDLIGKYLFQDPLVHTATYVVKQVIKLSQDIRSYQHNMLLHFLENVPEENYGLNTQEANLVFSSIQESKIPWYAFWERNRAVSNWEKYGVNRFFENIRSANSRFRNYEDQYELGKRVNFAFQNVFDEGENKVLNLFDKKHIFSSKPSVAYHYEKPQKVKGTRMFLTLGRLGVQFVPLPGFVKNIVDRGLRSFYETQMQTDGALYTYLELRGDGETLKNVKGQNLNPFNPLSKANKLYDK